MKQGGLRDPLVDDSSENAVQYHDCRMMEDWIESVAVDSTKMLRPHRNPKAHRAGRTGRQAPGQAAMGSGLWQRHPKIRGYRTLPDVPAGTWKVDA